MSVEYRVVCADGRPAFPDRYDTPEAKARALDKRGCWPDCPGGHRVQVRTVTVSEWADRDSQLEFT